MIGGCGLAGMIWRLAKLRTDITVNPHPQERVTVEAAAPQGWPASREFYRLTDRAWSWWTGNRHHHKAGFNVSVKL
jgi:hypothetical protein